MGRKTKILVIDDEKKLCNLFKEVLTKEGYTVYSALNGEKGLKEVKAKKPEVILLDIKMPKLGGIQVLKKIRKTNKEVIIIMITAYGTIGLAKKAMELGAYDFITKPFDFKFVKGLIKESLGE